MSEVSYELFSLSCCWGLLALVASGGYVNDPLGVARRGASSGFGLNYYCYLFCFQSCPSAFFSLLSFIFLLR